MNLNRYPPEETARRIGDRLGVWYEEIFPDYLHHVVKSASVRTVPEPEIVALVEAQKLVSLPMQEGNVEARELCEILESGLEKEMGGRNSEIVRMCFGLDGSEGGPAGAAAKYGLTRARVDQIVKKALVRMKRHKILRQFL